MSKDCCDKASSIISAECIYDNGKFIMGRLPSCLPSLSTLRFTAPVDYTEGDVVTVNGKTLTVRIPGLTAVPTDIFKSGDVIHCDIDLDRELAFFSQNSNTSCDCHTGRRLLTAATTYYLRKDGNDNNDGLSEESAFETWDRMWQELMTIDGSGNALTINLGVGTWENTFTFDGRRCIGFTQITLLGQGDDTIISPNGGDGVFAGYGSILVYVQDVLIHGADNGLYCYSGGVLRAKGRVILSGTIDAGIYACLSSYISIEIGANIIFKDNLSCDTLIRSAYGSLVSTQASSSIFLVGSNAGEQFIYSRWNGQVNINNAASISGPFTGKKYHVTACGFLYSGGNTIPGTLAGTTSTNGYVC